VTKLYTDEAKINSHENLAFA